ncbi:MAG TPA: sugar transferase [Deltaproteobacteria bacterium]|nr:sugar transferase [Deltaproteobacteria bacterium]
MIKKKKKILDKWTRFWTHIKELFDLRKNKPNKPSLCGVHSVGQFRALVEHERKRSDRTGDRFSVVVFPMEGGNVDQHSFCLLPNFLVQSVRSTDEVGWFDTNQIAVLLLDTPPEGAHKFLSKIHRNVPSSWSLPKSQVYIYPSEELSGDQGDSARDPILDMGEKMGSFKDSKTRESKTPRGIEPIDTTDHPIESAEEDKTFVDLGLEPHLGIKVPAWKRILDITSALTGLFLLSPFLILIAVVIKTVSPGPVLFRQKRIGYLGKSFNLLKFRTMKVNTKNSPHVNYVRTLIKHDVPMKKMDRHEDIIPFGKFLRSSGIDELPQLINVLYGEMSLVGPRPCTPSEFQEYLHWHKRRFYTLPGITGLWQINGKHKLTFKQMIRYDITYEQQRSFWLDLKIITRTFPVVYHLTTDG